MEKTIQTQEVLTTGKAVYEKPTSQMYELEVEGTILQASGTTSTTNQVFEESDDNEW